MYLISGIVVQGWWYAYRYGIPLFYECYVMHGPCMTGVNHPHTYGWPPTMPNECSAVTLVLGPKSLNHASHQCYSDPKMMNSSLICYPTVLWILYEACTSDRGGSPHIPLNDLQLHHWHHQQLPLFSEQRRACTMYLISRVVVQGRRCRYG